MTILKGQDAINATQGAIVLDMGDLRRQAERIISDAQAQAKQLIAAARARSEVDCEKALAEARERGQAEGLTQGLEEGRKLGREEALAQMREQLDRVEAVWMEAGQQLESQREAMMREARRGVLELAVQMGRKVVHRVIEIDPTVIEDQLDVALGVVLRPAEVTIRIHPEDSALVNEVMPRLREQYSNLKHVTIVDDATSSSSGSSGATSSSSGVAAPGRGGCVVTFGQGQVDARVETQIERIVRALLPGGTSVASLPSQAIESPSSSSPSPVSNGMNAEDVDEGENAQDPPLDD